MKKEIKDYHGILQVLLIPLFWFVALLKILIAIPLLIISKCNEIIKG